jgi:hypothetical protein
MVVDPRPQDQARHVMRRVLQIDAIPDIPDMPPGP